MKYYHFLIAAIAVLIIACDGNAEEEQEREGINSDTLTVTDTILDTPISEDDSEDKAALLQSLVGEYYLESISGFAGANTMMDYYLEDETWAASGSSNNGGQREGYDIELSSDDLERLASAKIVVSSDLSVHYSCKGVSYFKAPFQADRMTYKLQGAPEDFIMGVPEGLEASTTFLEGSLMLYAEDNIPEEKMKPIDIAEVWADAVVIGYDLVDSAFVMSLFYGDCCDNSTYTFR